MLSDKEKEFFTKLRDLFMEYGVECLYSDSSMDIRGREKSLYWDWTGNQLRVWEKQDLLELGEILG